MPEAPVIQTPVVPEAPAVETRSIQAPAVPEAPAVEAPAVQPTPDGGAVVTVPEEPVAQAPVVEQPAVIEQPTVVEQPTVIDTPDGGAVVTMPEAPYVPENVADTFDPDTVDYVEVGDAGGDFGDYGGAGSINDGGYCPAPWINILLADGGTVKAGDIKPGMEVYTRHETTNEWGVYPVSAVEMSEDTRWEVLLEDGRSFVGSANHRVHTGDDWTEIHALKAGDKLVQPEGFGVVKSSAKLDHGPVVKITVADAHTYISEGFLSHNVKMIQADDGGFGGGFSSDFGQYDWSSYANGGLMAAHYAMGGSTLGGYSDGGRLLKGPGDGVSDSIPATIGNKQPARLADGEFVIPARIVSELGNGSTDAGARKLYQMMDRIQAARKKTTGKNRVAVNSRADKMMPV